MSAVKIVLTDEPPEPGWRAVFSTEDLPRAAVPPFGPRVPPLWGTPAVCEIEGRAMAFTSSPLVPKGQVYVINEAVLAPTPEGTQP